MAVYKEENNNDYASKGVGTAGLTLGVIGTALASGILGGGPIGGLFGGPRPLLPLQLAPLLPPPVTANQEGLHADFS